MIFQWHCAVNKRRAFGGLTEAISCLDDGILLNAALLHEIHPVWSDTNITWNEKEKRKYNRSSHAMANWRDLVKAVRLTNNTFAFTRGLAMPNT